MDAHTVSNMERLAERLTTLLASIDNAEMRLSAAIAQGFADERIAAMSAGEIGKVIAAKHAYDEARGR